MVSSPSVKLQRRDRLYFNKYRYRATATVKSASRIRYCKTVDALYDRLDSDARYSSTQAGSVVDPQQRQQEISALVALLEFRNRSHDCCMLLNMSKVSVFSNNLSALEIFNLAFASEITEAQPVSTDTVLCRRNPRHAYRTYLRARKITQQEEHDLAQWFDHQPAVKPSAALKLWLTGPAGRSWYNRCSLRADYYFEYDAVSTATAFNLCFNNLLGKTLELRRLE